VNVFFKEVAASLEAHSLFKSGTFLHLPGGAIEKKILDDDAPIRAFLSMS